MPLGPRTSVPWIPATPPKLGLLSAVEPMRITERWQGGFAFEPEGCQAVGTFDPCNSATKNLPLAQAIVEYDPVLLVAGDRCSPWGFSARDWQGRARRLLEACQSKLLAAELWTGKLAKSAGFPNKYLAHPNANTLTIVPVSPAEALSCLESALSDCGCSAGVIHATPATVSAWAQANLVYREDGYLVTIMGTKVITDAGYDGSGPDGQPAVTGRVWAYGTDAVGIFLDEIKVYPSNFAEALNREKNLIEFRAERLAAATWGGCCHVAVEIDINLCPHPQAS